MKQSFEAKLRAHGPGGAWTSLDVPFDVHEIFGTKSRVSVCGRINGFPYRNSLMPNGDGTHSMAVNKSLQAGANARAGDTVSIVMEPDNKKRLANPPTELKAALSSDPEASKVYETLSPSHQREFSDWVGSAKQAATRLVRAGKSLQLIRTRAHTR